MYFISMSTVISLVFYFDFILIGFDSCSVHVLCFFAKPSCIPLKVELWFTLQTQLCDTIFNNIFK